MSKWISRGLVAIGGAAVVVVMATGGLDELLDSLDDQSPAPAPDESEMVELAAELVDELTIAPEAHRDSYERDAFGSGWASENGCTVRALVLIDEAVSEAEVDDSCKVLDGEWDSWFDGETVTDPSEVDIDHLVPLAEAWASGAHAWDDERRREFYNDHDPQRPDALAAVTAASNREKGDQDPAEWMPPEVGAWCRYTAAWVIQKHHWELTADEDEHAQLVDTLDDCTSASN